MIVRLTLNFADVAKFDGVILKITRCQYLNRCMTHAVMKHLRLWLVLPLLLLPQLLLLLLEGEVVLIIALNLAGPGCCCINNRAEASTEHDCCC